MQYRTLLRTIQKTSNSPHCGSDNPFSASTQKPVQTRILTKLFKEIVPEDNHGNPSLKFFFYPILHRTLSQLAAWRLPNKERASTPLVRPGSYSTRSVWTSSEAERAVNVSGWMGEEEAALITESCGRRNKALMSQPGRRYEQQKRANTCADSVN